MRRISLSLVFTALIASASTLGATDPVTLTPDELRNAAAAALHAGDVERAYTFSDALVQRNKNDRQAHLIRSRSARDLGVFHEAKRSARAAWSLAETPDQKYASSMVMAQALSSDNKRTRAQLWLRRAVHHASNDQLASRAVRDFRYVRARNPWHTALSFSITPDSNINNGSSERSSFLNYKITESLFGEQVAYELSGSAVALSGIEYQAGIATRYRFVETPTRAHDLLFSALYRTYSLSSESKGLAPDASGSDFAFGTYQLGYLQKGINLDRKGEYRLATSFGQSWYGSDEYARFFRLSAAQLFRMKGGKTIRTRLAGERLDGITRSDSDTVRADLSYSLPLGQGYQLWTNLTLARATASLSADEFDEIGLQAQLQLPKPILGATALLGMTLRGRNYDFSPHSADGRKEERVSADVTFVFNSVDYYGFNPTMRVSASNTNSNIDLYKARRFGVNFGIQSAF
ncbi:MAG: hypothetical protein ACU0BB_04315 [Paracoccaceae bacterium]